MAHPTSHSRIALIAMPWALFNRPSIQLGALKAYVESTSSVQVDCFHPYVDAAKRLGIEVYTGLSKNSWAGEALYAAMVYPDRSREAAAVFRKSSRSLPNAASDFFGILEHLRANLADWAASVDFSRYTLAGFSVCFSQLFSSLAAAAEIKKRADIPIIFGGSSCVGPMGKSLVECFPQVDYAVEGEGETELVRLVENLAGGRNMKSADTFSRTLGLNGLPAPDYSDYFREVDQAFPGRPFNPRIPLEFSRGCWWRRCSFCNLNLQWTGYRYKKAEKVLAELAHHLEHYHCLDYTFCDNALPPGEIAAFFQTTADYGIDLDFFAEIRAISDPETLAALRRGGLSGVQVGIEALSTSLLGKMNKGTRVIDNLAVLKYCSECGIRLDGNLIVEFPGSSGAEVEETLANLEFALPFHPLSAATFFLGEGSPVDQEPQAYGIRSVRRHPYYGKLFPDDILETLHLLVKDYRGDKTLQRKQWSPVRRKIYQWHKFHDNRQDRSHFPLSYRDGGMFLLIRQERPASAPLLHRLRGRSRELYLFCGRIRTMAQIRERFPQIGEKAIRDFFADLSRKRLVFSEDDTFLSLAIRAGRPGNRRTSRFTSTTP